MQKTKTIFWGSVWTLIAIFFVLDIPYLFPNRPLDTEYFQPFEVAFPVTNTMLPNTMEYMNFYASILPKDANVIAEFPKK